MVETDKIHGSTLRDYRKLHQVSSGPALPGISFVAGRG